MLKQYFAAIVSFTSTLFKHTSGLQLTSPAIPAMLIILCQVMGFLLVGRMTSSFRRLHTWHRACGSIPLSQTKNKISASNLGINRLWRLHTVAAFKYVSGTLSIC